MRSGCPQCLRPQSACICSWRTPTANQVGVVLLQHPLEVKQAKGSARLLHMSLARSRLLCGETFDQTLLGAHLGLGQGGPLNVLLYPVNEDEDAGVPVVDAARLALGDPGDIRLWVLDGTWRKSRKMLYLNPVLRRLPRLALTAPPPSHYVVRKAQRPGQLSTLEAVCLALGELEGRPDRYAPLMAAFDGFVGSLRR